jgi:hypothetical protein
VTTSIKLVTPALVTTSIKLVKPALVTTSIKCRLDCNLKEMVAKAGLTVT